MKNINPLCKKIALLLFLAGLFACRKSEIKPVNDPGTQEQGTHGLKSLSFRGVYVDNFAHKIGVAASEDSLLNWCLANDLNEISLYGMCDMLSWRTGPASLNSFIAKANAAPYNINVALVASDLYSSTYEYANYYLLYPNKFSAITTEYEFWNRGYSYTTFKGQLNYLKTINESTSGDIKRQIYFSRFVDAEGIVTDEATIAQRMVSRADKIFLVNYSANAYNMSSTALNKIKKIAIAAHALNKITQIVILFNLNRDSGDPDIYNYFSVTGDNHPFSDAYTKFKSDYTAATFSYKSYIQIMGFQLYNYSSAKTARP